MRNKKFVKHTSRAFAILMSAMMAVGIAMPVNAAGKKDSKKEDKTETVYVNANADGSVDIIPSGPDGEEPTPTPTPDPTPTPEPDKDKGDIIKDHPIISKTGALIKENLVATFVLALDGLFILFFILWRKKRKDEEDEGAKVN